MILQRLFSRIKVDPNSGKVGNLYFVSTESGLENKLLEPYIPNNFLTRGKFVNWQVPRFRLYTTIDDALSGVYLGANLGVGSVYHVYKATGLRNENLFLPSITDAPYNMLISEWWYTALVSCEYIGDVKVSGIKEKCNFRYGPRNSIAELIKWNYVNI